MGDRNKIFVGGDTVAVMVSVAVEGAYSYRVPDEMTLSRGAIVTVPLGPRDTLGVVWGAPKDSVAHNRLRDVERCFDVPGLSEELLKLIDWVAKYTLAPPGMVLRAVLRSRDALDPPKPVLAYQATGFEPERMSNARQRVLDVVGDGMAWSKSALLAESGVSASVITGLVKLAALDIVELPPEKIIKDPDPDFAKIILNSQQQDALTAISVAQQNKPSVVLLDGVTGSGKTEVFLEAVAKVLAKGKQVLILLPEIALTHAFLDRVHKRFGARPGEWHSDMTPVQRTRMWRAVLQDEVQIVVGARSALFLPFHNLGLIVLDEEHDGAFKQSDGVNYHARDMAVKRAQLAGASVILSSATPSVESRHNANQGRYGHVKIDVRFDDAKLPDIEAIDMRTEGPEKGFWIAPRLVEEIKATLGRDEQVLLFLNRRGYAPLTVCKSCGFQYQCPDCSAWLVEHRFRGVLACHYCGHEIRRPQTCDNCGTGDSLIPIGPGIERIAEEVALRFPEARRVILSSDMGGHGQIRQRFAEIAAGEHDLIIGTQLVAKGHHFEKLTLVGVLDADLGLAHGDPRAGEKTFQILTQVTGRAGRAAKAGRALLQTYHPEHAVIQTMVKGDSEGFYAHELKIRQQGALPPFGRLAALIVSADEHKVALGHARHLLSVAPKAEAITLFGPADAPVAMVRARHRVRLLVQSKRDFDLSGYVRFWLEGAEKPRGNLRVQVDIDPVSFY